ncbi:hypothetical protein JOB18_012860 [Solea senegalensis]|uniref:Uncharacterized protein n=1 Tax=Solea senegalensis TaxID=28829 RepID=A0AAV6SCJ8_SOLSE|nr:hypothetical protein JOB18_012860 [Solea senegalensis]
MRELQQQQQPVSFSPTEAQRRASAAGGFNHHRSDVTANVPLTVTIAARIAAINATHGPQRQQEARGCVSTSHLARRARLSSSQTEGSGGGDVYEHSRSLSRQLKRESCPLEIGVGPAAKTNCFSKIGSPEAAQTFVLQVQEVK